MTMRNRVWPLCLAAFLFLAAVQAAFFSLGAAAETAPVAEATLLPADAESASPYRIVLTAPGGWSSGNSAVMKVSVTDINHIGWQKIEYRMNESAWIDCESQFADGKAELALHENGTFTLRVTDPQGHAFEESAQVACIDLTAPVLSASINGTLLEVFVEDDLSGVAGVQVNSMLFTTLTNGALHVELDENMNRFEKLAVRAFDYAGNFSEPVSLDNPHYTQPADPTPMPTDTPEPTAKPTGEKETASPVPTATPVSSANRYNGLGSSLIYTDLSEMSDMYLEMLMATESGELCSERFNFYGPGPIGSINNTVTTQLGIPTITVETYRGYELERRIGDQLDIVEYVLRYYGLI